MGAFRAAVTGKCQEGVRLVLPQPSEGIRSNPERTDSERRLRLNPVFLKAQATPRYFPPKLLCLPCQESSGNQTKICVWISLRYSRSARAAGTESLKESQPGNSDFFHTSLHSSSLHHNNSSLSKQVNVGIAMRRATKRDVVLWFPVFLK